MLSSAPLVITVKQAHYKPLLLGWRAESGERGGRKTNQPAEGQLRGGKKRPKTPHHLNIHSPSLCTSFIYITSHTPLCFHHFWLFRLWLGSSSSRIFSSHFWLPRTFLTHQKTKNHPPFTFFDARPEICVLYL
jgi:hypothetical protein